jgi:hypothetical protein
MRFWRMRAPSFSCSWLNDTPWDWIALNSFTGTFTVPQETQPFQIERGFEAATPVILAAPVAILPRGYRFSRSTS